MPTVMVSYDTFCDDPVKEAGEVEVILFRSREDWSKYFQLKDGEVCGANIGIERRLNCGTAFAIDKYSHSGVVYSLHDEGMQCRWDTTRWAGILLVKNTKSWRKSFKTTEAREDAARSWITEYSEWASGNIFEWMITDDVGEHIEGCSGYIGYDAVPHMVSDIVSNLIRYQQDHPEDTELEFEGDVDFKDEILKALAKERSDGQPVLC